MSEYKEIVDILQQPNIVVQCLLIGPLYLSASFCILTWTPDSQSSRGRMAQQQPVPKISNFNVILWFICDSYFATKRIFISKEPLPRLFQDVQHAGICPRHSWWTATRKKIETSQITRNQIQFQMSEHYEKLKVIR